MSKNALQNHWQRHDWQHSPFAPQLRIVQALVGGKTASGAGFSRYDALSRCMGETAEIMALNTGESSAGMAAGPDISFATAHALAERLERWALWDWWHGSLTAQPLVAAALVEKLRQGAVEQRETQLWHLPGFPHLHVVIARSRSLGGTQPILGFGADICPQKATHSALIELGLMELNLHRPPHAYFARLTARGHSHFPRGTPKPLAASPEAASLATRLTTPFSVQNRTPPAQPLLVVKAHIPAAPHWGNDRGPLL